MKQILLIGKFNSTTQNLKQILKQQYGVQLASDNAEFIAELFDMDVPDLVLIITTDMGEAHRQIFENIRQKYDKIPVICIGTGEELALFDDFLEGDQFSKVVRPVQMKTISGLIMERLHIRNESEDDDETEMYGNRKKKIVIIDDSGVQRNMIKNLLENRYDIKLASSGKEAMVTMKNWLPDLIILDYDMPDQDGREMFETFQNEDRLCDIPVIFLTGVKERQKIQAVLKLQPAGYILKPVHQQKLLDLLEDVLHC